jgi:hypothetical protein
MSPFSPGRRLFSTASSAAILVAILHTIGSVAPGGEDAGMPAVRAGMEGYRIPLGMGMSPSIWDIFRSLTFTMSVCLFAIGALGLALASDSQATPGVLSRTALVFAIASAILTLMYAYYRIPPPLISMAVVTVLYVVAIKG